MQYIPAILSAANAVNSIRGGKQQKALADAQASNQRALAEIRAKNDTAAIALQSTQYRLQATQSRIAYERQAVDVARKMGSTQAAIRARAAAGGVRAFEGSAETVFSDAGYWGGREYGVALENADLAEQFGFLQADMFESVGNTNVMFNLASSNVGSDALEAAGAAAESAGLTKGLSYFMQAGYDFYKLSTPTAGGPQPKKSASLIGDFYEGARYA